MKTDSQDLQRRQLLKTLTTSTTALLTWACAGSAAAQKPTANNPAASRGVEFADLMPLLMHPAGAVGPLPWSALKAWPVAWRSAAANRLPRPQPGLTLLRMGQLVLLIDGQPAYREGGRPGTWALGAYGNETGVAEISIGSLQLAAQNGLSLLALKPRGFALEAVCQPQGAQGDRVWRISHARHAPMRIVEAVSQGSGGIGVELRLPYTPAQIQQAVCG